MKKNIKNFIKPNFSLAFQTFFWNEEIFQDSYRIHSRLEAINLHSIWTSFQFKFNLIGMLISLNRFIVNFFFSLGPGLLRAPYLGGLLETLEIFFFFHILNIYILNVQNMEQVSDVSKDECVMGCDQWSRRYNSQNLYRRCYVVWILFF